MNQPLLPEFLSEANTVCHIARCGEPIMNEQQKKILTMLDMSKDEQRSWCWFNIESVHERYYRKQDISLADLVFCLRDEANQTLRPYWMWSSGAMQCVYEKVTGTPLAPQHEGYVIAHAWLVYHAKPIHWIVLVLMAKAEESDNDKTGD